MKDTNEIVSADTVKLTVDAPEQIKEKLSEEFILELARQLTREIERAMSVKGLAGSNIELKLAFAPETFMEHTSENITYRRLLITDKACGTKDFWVKWTRNNGAVAFSMCDTPAEGEITFELGEDVPQKIREKEYRFLVRANTDKYHYAMGRRNVTEWRELIKRAVKRGDLERVVSEVEIADHSADVHDALSSILSTFGKDAPAPAVEEPAESTENLEFEEAMRKAQEAVFGQYYDDEAENDASVAEDIPFDFSAVVEEDGASDEFSVIEDEEESEEAEEEPEEELAEEDGIDEAELADELEEEPEEEVEQAPSKIDEEQIRAEAEAKVRCEYELAARERAEAECDRVRGELQMVREDLSQVKGELEEVRRENIILTSENERLKQLSEALSAQKAKIEAEMEEEHRKLREEIEARTRAEARERERLEEAARLAVMEQRRAEEERIERERLEAERLRLAEEKARREEEEARIEEERAREAERIRRETEIARGNVLPEQNNEKAHESQPDEPTEYTYISRKVKLLFKNLIDPNITARIHEIIKTTVEYYKKENVSIKIKASVPDEKTVVLDFVKIPKEENELFVNIIKVLGGSNLGITKAIVE